MGSKTHIIVIALILLVIMFAAHMVRQMDRGAAATSTKPIVIDETRFIHVIRASWGRNCHGKKRRSSPAVTLGITEEGVYSTPFYDIAENNAYKIVADKCNNRRSCTLEANSDFIGFDAAPNCTKELVVEYRCFSYDTPWIKKAKQKQTMVIDCVTNGQ